jgi:hypothetical protein
LPGITRTLGPGGIVAQPESIITTKSIPAALFSFISPSLPSSAGGNGFRNHLHPPARARVNVGVVTLGVLAVIPIIRFLLILLNIRLGLLFGINGWRRVI